MAPEGHPLPEDATTQTLNYALGNLGGKQKSWMTLPSNAPALPPVVPSQVTTNSLPSTVRGRGRPRKYPAPAPAPNTSPQNPNTTPQIPLQPRPTVETERQPPSNSTSPRLPNVLVPQNTATSGPSVAHVFPSPTPSEETSAYPPPHESASSKRPSEGQEQQAEKRRRSQVYGQGRPLSIANTTNACPDLPHRPSGQLDSRSPSFGMMASPQIPQGIQVHNPQPSRTPLQPHGPLMPPPTTSQAPNSQPSSCTTQPENRPMAPSAHHPSNDGGYARNDCLQTLSNFQTSYPPSPSHPQDARRLRVLWDATMDED